MQLLKLAECLNHVFLLCKGFRILTELFLHLKVLLEIKVTELAVDLHHIIELLHIELIGLSDVSVILCRNLPHRSPTVLDLPEFGESGIYVLLLFEQCLEVGDHSFLQCEVLFPFLLEFLVILGTLLLISVVEFLETGFYRSKRAFFLYVFRNCKPGIRLLFLEPPVESGLYSLGFLGHLQSFFICGKFLKKSDKLCKGLFRIIYSRFCAFSSFGH